jgi:hypothetical protein
LMLGRSCSEGPWLLWARDRKRLGTEGVRCVGAAGPGCQRTEVPLTMWTSILMILGAKVQKSKSLEEPAVV